jgi:hypothetical protein
VNFAGIEALKGNVTSLPEKAFAYRQKSHYISSKSAGRMFMQTATLKEATEKLGVSLSDMVRYHALGDQAFIEIDLKLPPITRLLTRIMTLKKPSNFGAKQFRG